MRHYTIEHFACYILAGVWAVVNSTPFSADRSWVRDKHGRHQWIVAAKAVYSIGPLGRLDLLADPPPPLLAPDYIGEDGASSLRWEADLGPLKPSTDVLVHGSAHAPSGKPVAEMHVGLRVNGVLKTLLVRGDNLLYEGISGLASTPPQPFTKMPIVYERAYGGFDRKDPDPLRHRLDRRNPVGVGFVTEPAHALHSRGPNILYPGRDPASGPAGFGPIASFWSPRAELAGSYDETWQNTRKPLLPADYQTRHTLSAPVDQQAPAYLGPGTRIEVVHMTPEPVLGFEVPSARPKMTTLFGRKAVAHPAYLVTIAVETETRRVTLVWQSSLDVATSRVEALDGTVVEMV